MSLPEIGTVFGVTHKSVESVFRELGIPRRKPGHSRNSKCIVCKRPVKKIVHAKNGSEYGKRCAKHQREHKFKLFINAYYKGPERPEGDGEWLKKSKVLLRRRFSAAVTGSR